MKKNNLAITLIIPYYSNMFSTFYTLEIIKEASKAAIKLGADLLIATAWKNHSSAGVLFADAMDNERWIKKARKEKIPYLLLNYYDAASKDNCIGIDNAKASFEAVNYLIKTGHRRIATITGKLNAQAGRDRLAGFKKAVRANKLDLDKDCIVTGDWTRESGRGAMKEFLSQDKDSRPTAVFVAGDEMAIGAMEIAKEAGLRIPEDISFVGFDNVPDAALPGVSLTTIEQPFSDLASLGMENLIKVIKNKSKPPIKILLDNTRLIKRTSVKELLR